MGLKNGSLDSWLTRAGSCWHEALALMQLDIKNIPSLFLAEELLLAMPLLHRRIQDSLILLLLHSRTIEDSAW